MRGRPLNTRPKTLFLCFACLLFLLACNFGAAGTDVPTTLPAGATPTFTTAPTQTAARPGPTAVPTATPTTPPAAAAPTATPTALPTTAPVEVMYGTLARRHLVALAEDMGARVSGSPEDAQAAAYIRAAFEAYGYQTQVQPFTFYTEDDQELDSANVIAVKPGASTQEILVGAHYDSTDDAAGADDNASGVAVLLEVAALLQAEQTPYTVRLIAFGAEEWDLDGSRYYVDEMDRAAIQNTVAMINLDSLIAGDIAYVYGDVGAGSLRDWIIHRAAALDLELEARTDRDLDDEEGNPCDCADYGPFEEAGIPFAYFEATNWNLGDEDGMTQVDPALGRRGEIRHTRYDTVDYIDETFPGRIDHHLNLFVTLLYHALTEFRAGG